MRLELFWFRHYLKTDEDKPVFDQYWKFMFTKKYELIYLGMQRHHYIQIERISNIVLAIISTGSLTSLLITKELKIILAIILALAQIYTAAKPFLPFESRSRDLGAEISALAVLYSRIEKEWHLVSQGLLSDEDINNKKYEYMEEWEKIDCRFFQYDSLPRNEKMRDAATQEAILYFKQSIGGF